MLFGGGASWIAYPAQKEGVVSGTCRTEEITSRLRPNEKGIIGISGDVKFGTKEFTTIPRAFIAFSMVSVSRGTVLQIKVVIDSINEVEMSWRINAWNGTRLDAAEAWYIVTS